MGHVSPISVEGPPAAVGMEPFPTDKGTVYFARVIPSTVLDGERGSLHRPNEKVVKSLIEIPMGDRQSRSFGEVLNLSSKCVLPGMSENPQPQFQRKAIHHDRGLKVCKNMYVLAHDGNIQIRYG